MKALRWILALALLAAPLQGQTVSQDSVRAKVAGDSIVRISTSSRVDRLARELQAIVNRLVKALRAAVPAPAPAPPPVPAPPPPPPASVPDAPGTPAFSVNGSSVAVSWAVAAGATSYRYAAGRNSGPAWADRSGTNPTPGIVLLDVPAGLSLWFCATGVNAAGAGESACNSVTTPSGAPAPPPPPPPADTTPTPPPVVTPPPPANGTALRFEPDQYASTADLLAATGRWDPYNLTDAKPFIAVEDINVAGNVSLQTTGCPGRQKFMRYQFPASPAGEVTVGRMLGFNNLDSQQDVWIEMTFRMGANFLAAISGNTSASPVTAYKFVFLTFPSTGRFQQVLVYDNTTAVIGDKAVEDRGLFAYPNIMDGAWHVLRWHAKRHPTNGVNVIVMDGAPVYSYTGNTGTADGTRWYGFAIGRNSNRGFSQSTTLDVCWVALSTQNPGWGF